jgi:hypothetical protein
MPLKAARASGGRAQRMEMLDEIEEWGLLMVRPPWMYLHSA